MSGSPKQAPELSVVVCSLGAATPAETADSIAASAAAAGVRCEIILVWQAESLPPELAADVRVLNRFPLGLSHARNEGLAAAAAEIVAFVDDDELVDEGWAAAVVGGFRRADGVEPAGLFGPVAPRDERGLPYCHYEGSEPRVFRGSQPPWTVGTGGNMAFRRDRLAEIGGFSLALGAGSSGHAGEESDVIVALLARGETLAWVPEMVAYHPTKDEAEHLASRFPYGFGMGRTIRRRRAPILFGKYAKAIVESLMTGFRTRDRRRRREAWATLKGFLCGVLARPRALSPLGALERAPEDVRGALGTSAPRRLPLREGAAKELRYRGRGRAVLHGRVDGPDAHWVVATRGRVAPLEGTGEAVVMPESDAATATTGASVLTGGLWQTASSLLPQAYALIQSVVAARFLGPSGMGVQSLIAFTSISLSALLSQGFSIALMRSISETRGRGRPDELRALVRWGWIVEGIAALAGGGVLVVAALTGASPRAAWVLAAFVCALTIIHTIPSAVLIGAQRWRDASVVGLVTSTVGTAAIVAALSAGGGVTSMFAVEAVVGAANMAWTVLLSRRTLNRLSERSTPSPALRRSTARYAALMSYSALLTFVVWRRTEIFFLQHYSTHTQIALYSIAFSAMTALVAVPQALGAVISPAVATLFGAGAWDRIRTGYSRGLRLLLMTTLPLTAGTLAVGPALLKLVYGGQYSGTGPVLLLLLAPLPLIPLVSLARAFLFGLGRLRYQLTVGTIAAILNLGLDYLLVPGHGAVGAAAANSISQVIAGIPLFVYTSVVIGDVRWEWPAIFRTALASAATWLAAWSVVTAVGGVAGLLLAIVAGATAFVVLATTLRVLPVDDANWLEGVAGARFGGRIGRAVRSWSSAAAATRG